MSAPAISVVLPAYNCDQFIQQAINSILDQQFTDYELIIINDGSTDLTHNLIRLYRDERIVYINNTTNQGLIACLNQAINQARGKYTARMDADDICSPDRLGAQYFYMEAHPHIAVVASFINFINQDGQPAGSWPTDRLAASAPAIRAIMPRENCIAHPSVMMRTHIARRYRYATYQPHTEDYDLWLRLLADGYTIAKQPLELLYYRVHEQSVTKTRLQKRNPFFKQFHCKRRFLWHRLKKFSFGRFEAKVGYHCLHNLAHGIAKEIKKLVVK